MSSARADYTDELIERALQTEGGHLMIGRGGCTLHYDTGRLSGYDCEQMKAVCIARGLPVIDSREVPFETVWKLAVRGPMVAVGRAADPPPWHALSSVPLQVVADSYRAAGADVVNLPARNEHPRPSHVEKAIS